MKNKLSVGLLIFCLAVPLGTSAETLNLRDFEEKLRKANELEGILANSPEGKLLKSLNNIADSIDGNKPNVQQVDNTLTLVNSTDLIEELLPKDVSISFDKGFLAGSDLSVSDLANASYFLNSLNAKKLINMQNVTSLTSYATIHSQTTINFDNTTGSTKYVTPISGPLSKGNQYELKVKIENHSGGNIGFSQVLADGTVDLPNDARGSADGTFTGSAFTAHANSGVKAFAAANTSGKATFF